MLLKPLGVGHYPKDAHSGSATDSFPPTQVDAAPFPHTHLHTPHPLTPGPHWPEARWQGHSFLDTRLGKSLALPDICGPRIRGQEPPDWSPAGSLEIVLGPFWL